MMMNQATFQNGLYLDYPIQYPMSGSSIQEPDIKEVLDNLFSIPYREKPLPIIFRQDLLSLFEIDFSSVQPYFGVKSGLLRESEKISETMLIAEMLIYDFIVRVPPKKKYRMEIRVENIKRGEPTIIVPEEFL